MKASQLLRDAHRRVNNRWGLASALSAAGWGVAVPMSISAEAYKAVAAQIARVIGPMSTWEAQDVLSHQAQLVVLERSYAMLELGHR